MTLVGFTERVFTIKVPIGTVTAPYGSIDSIHKSPHTGVDLACNFSDHIYTPLDGVISRIVNQPHGLGHGIFIRLHDGKQMIFGHFSEINPNLTIGKVVHKGDYLGDCGSSGNSTGSHLHFSVLDTKGHFIDPETLFESIKSSLSQWANKVLVFKPESQTAFMNNPDIVSFDEPTRILFKLFDVVTEII
jgi:murein DD-endopeptidase MepM/ murein hydrolase activator NlpD